MKIRTSAGFEYAYSPINNRIVNGESLVIPGLNIVFKPIEEITELPHISEFTIGVTEQCNLRCSYCCYSGIYPEHRKHSPNRLSFEKIPSILDFILKYSVSEEITVDFYGGESLLELDWIKAFVQKTREIESIDWRFEISTNGILLRPEIVEWLVQNGFKIFVSVDGIGHFHDECRKDIKGQPTYSYIETNLFYIKEHYPNYWTDNVHIMMTVHDVTQLSDIANAWKSSTVFKGKTPYRISEVSTIYNANTSKANESSELDKYIQLVDWYKCHPDNSVMNVFFNIWLGEWINRPIGEIESDIEYPTCVPYNRKLYIDATGTIGICERISDKIRLGSLEHGIDFSKLNEIRRKTASFIDQSCSNCEIARICDICPDILKITDEVKETYCHNQKAIQRIKLHCFCELAEAELI